jgi:hypothetical protein
MKSASHPTDKSADAMSVLFRKEGWLTVAQLTGGWGRELANGETADQYIQDLGHILLTDIVNGRLDDSGPLREDQRSGLRLITRENKAGIIEGDYVRNLLNISTPISKISHHVLVMKEAVLDFASRHALPPPSWWSDDTSVPTDAGEATKATRSIGASAIPAPTHSARPRGRRPKKLDRVKENMREDIRLGRQTPEGLRDTLEKNLASQYRVSRDTARKARDAILSEMPPQPTTGRQGETGRA